MYFQQISVLNITAMLHVDSTLLQVVNVCSAHVLRKQVIGTIKFLIWGQATDLLYVVLVNPADGRMLLALHPTVNANCVQKANLLMLLALHPMINANFVQKANGLMLLDFLRTTIASNAWQQNGLMKLVCLRTNVQHA